MLNDEIVIERLAEANDRAMSRLGLGAAPYQYENDADEFDWNGWYADHETDRMREGTHE